MIVVVTGGRTYANRPKIDAELTAYQPSMVVEGGSSGADFHARWWAAKREVPCLTFPAQWSTEGKKAGPMRNERMLRFAATLAHAVKSQLVVVAFPGGAGTKDCISKAKAMELRVDVVADPMTLLPEVEN